MSGELALGRIGQEIEYHGENPDLAFQEIKDYLEKEKIIIAIAGERMNNQGVIVQIGRRHEDDKQVLYLLVSSHDIGGVGRLREQIKSKFTYWGRRDGR